MKSKSNLGLVDDVRALVEELYLGGRISLLERTKCLSFVDSRRRPPDQLENAPKCRLRIVKLDP